MTISDDRIRELRKLEKVAIEHRLRSVTIDTTDYIALLDAAERAKRLEEDIKTIGHVVDTTLTLLPLVSNQEAVVKATEALRAIGSVVSGDYRKALNGGGE